MNNTTHISQDDLFLFALQFLSEDEMTVAYDHISVCDDCRRQVAWIQGDLVAYGLTAEMQEPPTGARERLMRRVAKEKKILPLDHHVVTADISGQKVVSIDTARPRRAAVFMAWTGWATAAALAAAVGLEYHQKQVTETNLASAIQATAQLSSDSARAQKVLATLTAADAQRVTLRYLPAAATPPQPQGQASYVAEKGSLVFVASNLQPLQEAKVYELWLLPADKSAPIPAGTFRPDQSGHASVVMPTLPQGVAAGGFGVTVEPEGGSAKPNMPSLFLLGQ